MTSAVRQYEKAEKGQALLSAPGDHFAYWLSQFSSPFVVGLTVFGYVALSTASSMIEGFAWFAVVVVGLGAPFGVVWWGVRKKKWTDLHVSRRSQRLVPLLFGLAGLVGMLASLLLLSVSRQLVATLVAVIVSFAVATLMTQFARFKISLHVDSAAGTVAVFCLLASPMFLALAPLVILIAWARWRLEAHTPLQLLAGAVLGAIAPVATFGLFGLH